MVVSEGIGIVDAAVVMVLAPRALDSSEVAARTNVERHRGPTSRPTNLRGTGFAARHWEMRSITAHIDGVPQTVPLRVATLPAYLLAKTHAAHGRGLPKDWYDIAYVLLHNDDGGPGPEGRRVREQFGDDLVGATVTALSELSANFADENAQGSVALASTMAGIHPELDSDVLANEAVAAVAEFVGALGP